MMRKRSKSRAPHGVTLVELMVVVALIAVLAAVASPSVFRAIERANARSVANEVANQLSLARNQAMSRGEPLWVSLADRDPGTTEGGFIAIWRQTGTPVTPAVACADGICPMGQVCKCPLTDPNCDRSARVCFEDVPLSCREGFTSTNWQVLAQTELSEIHTGYSLRITRPNQDACPVGIQLPPPAPTATDAPCDTMLCFEPDGRVLRQNGLPLSQLTNAEVCETEDFAAFTAPDSVGASYTASTNNNLDCETTTAAARKVQREQWDQKLIYKISLPYHGAVKVVR